VLSERSGFDDVFVPPNPGNAGLAAGAALSVGCRTQSNRERVSPFLGPEYQPDDIKAVLDNCKLSYEYLSHDDVIDVGVRELRAGRLVGWFQGRMEWGHRALGNRSILADPFGPYVLDNLNVYLKRRERYRAYGLSVCEEDVTRYFDGPSRSLWMEYDYQVKDADRFHHVLPPAVSRVRVQTIDPSATLFRELHRAFADVSGSGVLVNTSFNGFSEPIVCSPRDAIRVFYGTGLDVVVLGSFIVRK
jgi:carbamoyltransferase